MLRAWRIHRVVIVLLIEVAIFGGGSATAEPDPAPSGEQVILRVKHIPSRELPYPSARVDRRIYETFIGSHPNVRFKSFAELMVEGTQADAANLMAIAAKTAPDFFGYLALQPFSLRKVQTFIDQGFLLPLDDYVPPETLNTLVPDSIRKGLKRDGHIYGAVPVTGYNGLGLLYRRDVFLDEGIVDENGNAKPPRTWDELFECAKQLTYTRADGKPQFGMGLNVGSGGVMFLTSLLYQAGSDIVEERAPGKWRLTLGDEASIDALMFLRKLIREEWERDGIQYTGVAKVYTDSTSMGQAEYRRDFAVGMTEHTAMIIAWVDQQNLRALTEEFGMDPFMLGIAPLPAGPGGEGTVFATQVYALNSATRGTPRAQAAAEFIQFASSEEHARIFTETFVKMGMGRFLRADLLKRFGYDRLYAEVPPDTLAFYDHALRYGRPEPYCPGYSKVAEHTLAKLMDLAVYDDRSATREGMRELVAGEVRDTNTVVFGTRPPELTATYRSRGHKVFLLLGILVVSVLAWKAHAALKARRENKGLLLYERLPLRKHVSAWLMMLPAVCAVLVWQYIPLGLGTTMAFQDYRLLGGGRFIGIDNFVEAATSPLFWQVMVNTFQYVAMTLILGFFAPIVLALMLTEIRRFTMIYRTIFYLPAITSPLVLMYLWKLLYKPTPDGFLNQLLGLLGLPHQGWLSDPNQAMACIVVAGVWAAAGPGSLIYMAALKAVPTEFYEAAAIDGCGLYRKIVHITVPTLKPLLIINFLGVFIASFRAMQNIFIMTGGGPADATRTIGIEIWFNAFMYLRFGYATAMSWILGSFLIGFTLFNLRIMRQVEFRRAEEA
ncbi:MAG: extracellular solute-binding protein [Nitrospiraceae bacterium]|nr:extracellular solute-binding protein [Nitrospiraceae bacterium]